MLESDIFIDLPSAETTRQLTSWEKVRAAMGEEIETRTGREEILVDLLAVVQGVFAALQQCRVSDIVCMTVNSKVVFEDKVGKADDLERAFNHVLRHGMLDGDVEDVVVVLDHRMADLRVTTALTLRTRVPVGDDEIHLRISGRLDRLRPSPWESAWGYDQRVHGFVRDLFGIETYRLLMRSFTVRLAKALRDALEGCPVRLEPTWVRVRRLDGHAVGRCSTLPFGEAMLEARYEPHPHYQPDREFYDPFSFFLHDPYEPFVHLTVLRAILAGHGWATDHVRVVDDAGAVLATGDALDRSALALDWEHDAVSFDDQGGLVLVRDP